MKRLGLLKEWSGRESSPKKMTTKKSRSREPLPKIEEGKALPPQEGEPPPVARMQEV